MTPTGLQEIGKVNASTVLISQAYALTKKERLSSLVAWGKSYILLFYSAEVKS